MSYAAMVSAPPSPEQRLKALTDFYKTLSPSMILSEGLGCYSPRLIKTPLEAVPLVEHILVICVDTESYTMNTDQMTELGIAYISRRTAKGVGPPGPHGWRLQEALKFLHLRVVEHAHLKSNRLDSKGPLGNRFGTTTFASFEELRHILSDIFNQVIETDNPVLKGCKRPVILVGHALRHDTENTNKPGLEYNLEDNLTLVAKVDTQALAREKKVWVPPVGMETNEIGLRVMIENLGFKHIDDHTACNDAARTMMFDTSEDREANITSHIETYCQHVAKFKAWLRRFLDALRKGRPLTVEVAAGPGPDSHPWSTWPPIGRWPLEKLSEAKYASDIIKYSPQWQQPAPFVHNMQASLGSIAVTPTGTWVPSPSGISTASTTTTASSVAPDASKGISMTTLSSALLSLPASGLTASAWNSGPPAVNGNQASAAASFPPPAPSHNATSAPVAGHTILMSESRGRVREARGRGNTRGGLGRGTPRSGRGSGSGAGGASSSSDSSWDPANVW
ncbi:hypothetical protein E8E12_004486 [Didymella heteroderae]|uniref:Gfd2/YDR514C-like C-terminal domain-containing protein n=1 Tax=Didymella heteroderae TaxID=1769908 RepID=A0A9P4WN97_9PLEO|nr:hypothetical protein E8E12_004486 [Didymella heteroderae]